MNKLTDNEFGAGLKRRQSEHTPICEATGSRGSLSHRTDTSTRAQCDGAFASCYDESQLIQASSRLLDMAKPDP
jgi:hypothetical protein